MVAENGVEATRETSRQEKREKESDARKTKTDVKFKR